MTKMTKFPQFQTSSLRTDALHCDGRGLAAADAERSDAAPGILRLHGVQQRDDQTCAGGADRVPERAGATIDVEPVAGNAEVALCGHRDHRKGLVDLEQIDIGCAPADLVE